MKITPRATNHIEIELDDGTLLDVNDGSGPRGAQITIRDMNAHGLHVEQDPLTDSISITSTGKDRRGRVVKYGPDTKHPIHPPTRVK